MNHRHPADRPDVGAPRMNATNTLPLGYHSLTETQRIEKAWYASEFSTLGPLFAFTDPRDEVLFALAVADQWTWEIGSYYAPTGRIYAVSADNDSMLWELVRDNADSVLPWYWTNSQVALESARDVLKTYPDSHFVLQAVHDSEMRAIRVTVTTQPNRMENMHDFISHARKFRNWARHNENVSPEDYRRISRTYWQYYSIYSTARDGYDPSK